MFASSEGRKSVDSLASPTGITHRADFPFHRQYPRQRRDSIASSTTSVGGSLDTALGGGWPDAVHEIGQNAISTLLQPPIVRTGLQPHTAAPAHSAHKPPTAKDIPPVALTNIEHVEASEFASYLKQVGALHDQLRRVKESEEEQQATTVGTPRRNSSKDDLSDGLGGDGHLHPGSRRTSGTRKPSVSSFSSATSLVEAPIPVRRSSSNFRRPNQGPPPLSTIPNVYFEDDFHLENPRTFDIVSERSEIVPPSTTSNGDKAGGLNGSATPRKALGTNAILQEKLSWYMDTVEMHLISSISTASTAFFTALGSLKELHTEAADSVDRIKALRTELGALNNEIAIRGLDIVQKQRRRQNIQQFHAAVVQLRDIVDDVGACETLVDDGEVNQALDGIDALEKLIAGERAGPKQGTTAPRNYPLRDLRGATALQGVNDDITTLRMRIGKAYESKFVTTLMKDIRQHAETVSNQEVLMRWNSAAMRARGTHSREPSAFPSYLASTDELRSTLLPILTGLHRAKHIAAATQAYREAVLREVRNLIRRPLPSSNDDDNESMMSSSTLGAMRQLSQQEKSSILARNLRALDAEDAEALLTKIYISVTETLRRFTTHVKLLLDVASSVGEDEMDNAALPFSPSGRHTQQLSSAGMEAQEEVHEALDMANLLGQAVDVAQDKIVKLLRVRSEQTAKLPVTEFLRYFTLNLHFANECEGISGRGGTTLKNVVNVQIKEFLKTYGDEAKMSLAQGMDLDQWVPEDFTDANNEVLQRILAASTRDADVWTADIKLWTPISTGDSDNEDADEEEAAKDNKDGNNDEDDGKAVSNGTKTKTRTAVIDSETFLLSRSSVICLEGMSLFMHLAVAIPFMTPEVASSLVQYLQLFNSRCTQLILGAGAIRSAGLRNITTKHLATASLALSFVAALIPYVREFIRRRANSISGGGGGGNSNGGGSNGGSASGGSATAAGLMGDFDKVRRLLQEHMNNIYDKMVEMMSHRAQTQAKALGSISWDTEEKGAEAVHVSVERLAKDTTQLYRILAKMLPEGTVQYIMGSVFGSYSEHLGDALATAAVTTKHGQDSMLRDIEYLNSRLGKVEGFNPVYEHLRSIVLAKAIEPPTPPPPEPAAAVAETPAEPSSEAAAADSAEKPEEEADDGASSPPPPPPKDDVTPAPTAAATTADASDTDAKDEEAAAPAIAEDADKAKAESSAEEK